MSEATLNPPNLEQINRDLAESFAEELQKNQRLSEALQGSVIMCESAAPAYTVLIGFETLDQAQRLHRLLVELGGAKTSESPAP